MRYRSDMAVEALQQMGSDAWVVHAAKVSTLGSSSFNELTDTDAQGKLINFLMKNRHGTPFEHNSITFLIEAPIFVFREFHRHRVGWSYNETSGRYRELEPEFWVPNKARKMVQTGKPGHYEFEKGNPTQHQRVIFDLQSSYENAWANYQDMLSKNVAKEVARVCLPVGIYSSMYATCNARSLMHFLGLRTKRVGSKFPSYPQREIEEVAEQMEAHFQKWMPLTYKSFCDNGRVAP